MTIHTAGENGLALFLDADDLALLGNTELNEKTAKKLVNSTLHDMGLEIRPVEISAFFGKQGAMLVALLGCGMPKQWAFYKLPDQNAFLDVWKISGDYERRHFKIKDEYYIAFPELAEPPSMNEFGKRVYRPQLFMKYLEEHNEEQRFYEARA
jgi:hypothetical protein